MLCVYPKYHDSRNCPKRFFLRSLLKAGMSLYNLRLLSSEFHMEIILYEKDFCQVAVLKRGMFNCWALRVTWPEISCLVVNCIVK
jgi:hypothetical protein